MFDILAASCKTGSAGLGTMTKPARLGGLLTRVALADGLGGGSQFGSLSRDNTSTARDWRPRWSLSGVRQSNLQNTTHQRWKLIKTTPPPFHRLSPFPTLRVGNLAAAASIICSRNLPLLSDPSQILRTGEFCRGDASRREALKEKQQREERQLCSSLMGL